MAPRQPPQGRAFPGEQDAVHHRDGAGRVTLAVAEQGEDAGWLARPDEADEARAPHRLFGYIDGAEACSAARWAADAKAVLAEGERPILVGGTGLYLRTLLDGIAPVPPIDPAVRAEVRALPVGEAYRALALADPSAAARLAPNDTTRVARALEVVRATGRPLAAWQADKIGGYIVWGAIWMFAIAGVLCVIAMLIGRGIHSPHLTKGGAVGLIVVLIAAIVYVAFPGVVNGIIGTGCIG